MTITFTFRYAAANSEQIRAVVEQLRQKATDLGLTGIGGLVCLNDDEIATHEFGDRFKLVDDTIIPVLPQAVCYFDGKLPGKWRVLVRRSAFQRGNSQVGFSVERGQRHGGGGGKHPAKGRACPNLFRVLHNDRIGRLRLPAGQYRITLLAKRRPTCQRAPKLFAKFLQRPDGKLPNGWDLDPGTATFTKRVGVGFRVKRVGN